MSNTGFQAQRYEKIGERSLLDGKKGGLKSSLLTDFIQIMLFAVLLFNILGILLPREQGNVAASVRTGECQMAQGARGAGYPTHK